MKSLTILISSAGRRVGLSRAFRESAEDLGVACRILAVDAALDSVASRLADGFWRVPRCTDPGFVPVVLDLCKRERVDLIIPTIDTELPVYSEERERFRAVGSVMWVSHPRTVQIAYDKEETHRWLVENDLATVRQATPAEVLAEPSNWQFPLIVKPRRGSAAIGVRRVETLRQLEVLTEGQRGLIVQEMARGQEHTINVFVDASGKCLCAIPHCRLEVRGGEVSKGVTVKHPPLMEMARQIAERLPGAFGPLNIQCFLDERGGIQVVEINARFGGGYPLAHQAGATFTRWILEETLGRPMTAAFDGWQDDLAMLRFDDAIYLPGSEIRAKSHATVLSSV
jgi:carbamoyl-phosphate synthase large subunit